MKTWHIWDFPDKVYLQLKKEVHDEFFNIMFKKCGGKRPYARFLRAKQMTVKQYHKGFTVKNNKIYPQSIPISLFKKSLPFIDKKLKKKVEENISLIKAKNRGTAILDPKLPIKESSALYRIIAHMIGDGSAPGNKVPYYANTCKILREQFKKDLKIFGKIKLYETKPNTTPIVNFPKVITDILSHVFKVKFTNPNRIPQQIFSSNKRYKGSFLQAIFDDEGSVGNNINIGMKEKKLIVEIKRLLENLNLKSGNIYKSDICNYLNIFEDSTKNFRNKVGFSHPLKNKILETKLKIKRRNKIQRTRPLEWTRSRIITLLKEKPMSSFELIEKLLLSRGGLNVHLKFLEKSNKIKRKYLKRKIIWHLSKV